MYIVAIGNPFDGTALFGPFVDNEKALDYAKQNARGSTWWVVPVNQVEREEMAAIAQGEDIEDDELYLGKLAE